MEMEGYTCSLDEHSIRKANTELHEDPKERCSALNTFKQWIEQQTWLKTPTDSTYLLGFLRARKFSQLGARELLENYWTIRTRLSEWYAGVDSGENKIQNIIRQGIYLPLPGRDKEGRKIVIVRLGAMDPKGKRNTFDDVMRANLALFDYLLMDENVQKALPGRIKQLHYYNTGPVFESVFNMIRPMMSEKLRNRVHVHGQNLSTVYEEIAQSMMPEEYLPDDYVGTHAGTIQNIADNLAEELRRPQVRDFIRDLHSGAYGVDLSLKPSDTVPQASFRKLAVS